MNETALKLRAFHELFQNRGRRMDMGRLCQLVGRLDLLSLRYYQQCRVHAQGQVLALQGAQKSAQTARMTTRRYPIRREVAPSARWFWSSRNAVVTW